MVRDLDDVPKTQTYFYHHNLDNNMNGSKLIAVRELSLYMNLTSHPINIGRIIYVDMDEITHSMRKVLGHAYVILQFFQKEGVKDVTPYLPQSIIHK